MIQTLCKTCNGPIISEWRKDKKTISTSPLSYCCRSCCNKKTVTDETKSKISKALLKSHSSTPKDHRVEDRKCLDCEKIISVSKVTPLDKGRCQECRATRKKKKEDLYYENTFIETECTICKKQFERSTKNGNASVCSPKCKGMYKLEQNDLRRRKLFTNGKIKHRPSIRRILLSNNGHVCSICNGTEWSNQLIPLQVDHIDGDASNNFPSNMRLVCYNCAAQLPTFTGRNRGKGRKSRGLRSHD